MGFTPGSWFAVGNEVLDKTVDFDDDGARIGDTPNLICKVKFPYGPLGLNGDSPEANATLIAAAPDLYTALDSLAIWWENWMPDDAHSQGGYEALQAARTALAKARGEGK